jgi:hypothetical protein
MDELRCPVCFHRGPLSYETTATEVGVCCHELGGGYRRWTGTANGCITFLVRSDDEPLTVEGIVEGDYLGVTLLNEDGQRMSVEIRRRDFVGA